MKEDVEKTEELAPPNDGDAIGGDELQEQLVADVMRKYIDLLLFARLGLEAWSLNSVLQKFEVHLPPDSDVGVIVRINDEDCFWTQPVATRSFSEGESIAPRDLAVKRVLIPEEEPSRYIRGEWDGLRWVVDMKLSTPHPRRTNHFQLGADFVFASMDALTRGTLGVFIENAFHAAEHFALAELLSYEITARIVVDAKSHKTVRTTYQTWARLGNTEDRFARLLTSLDDARAASTYLRGQQGINPGWAEGALKDLVAMRDWVRKVVNGDGPTSIRVVAQRAIAAGELVGLNDTGLRAG